MISYQYKVFNGNWVFFKNYNQLLNWLSTKNYRRELNNNGLVTTGNSILDYVGTNDTDTYFVGTNIPPYGYVEYAPRSYRVLDANEISIYSKALLEDVSNWEYSARLFDEWYEWHKKLVSSMGDTKKSRLRNYRRRLRNSYQFRIDPVPNTHSLRRGHICRHMRTTNERRQSCAPEMKEFNRGSRGIKLVNLYDDIFLDTRSRSWKSQTKDKHQWEHGVRNHINHTVGKHVYVVKGVDLKGS